MAKKQLNMNNSSEKNLDFSSMTVVELKKFAKENNISGISKLKKLDLINVLNKSSKNSFKSKLSKSENLDIVKKDLDFKNILDKSELINLLIQKINSDKWNIYKIEIENIITQLEKQFQNELLSEKKHFVSKGGQEADFYYKSIEKNEFDKLKFSYRNKKRAFFKEIENKKRLNGELKQEIITELKDLIGSDNSINTIYKKFKTLQERWHKSGPALRSENNNLWETYKHHVERFYDFLHINRELRNIDYKHNYDEKIKIIEKAEGLVKIEDVLKASRDLNILHRLWKNELGPVAPENREILWKRFQKASKTIHERRQNYHKNIEGNQKENLKRKNIILEEIKKLIDPIPENHKKWQLSINKFNQLKEEFKKIGSIPKSESKNNWHLFREAGRSFNYNKNQFYKNQKQNQKTIIDSYKKLLNEVKDINEKDDWKIHLKRMKTIQVEFNKLGFIPRKASKIFKSEFRTQANLYFNRLRSGNEKDNAEEKDLFNKKENIIKELDEVKFTEKNVTEIFLNEWKKIESLGKSSNLLENKIITIFLKKIKKIVKENKSIKNDKSNILFEIEVNCLSNNVQKLQDKIDFYKKSIDVLQNDINQLENNLDFFSKSSNDSPLLKEVTDNLNKLTTKLFTSKERVNKIKSLKNSLNKIDKKSDHPNDEILNEKD
tara:strand:+ start:2409 stop:4400 length:1992 start_codon:yes stop_codon:yes gene_type:complete